MCVSAYSCCRWLAFLIKGEKRRRSSCFIHIARFRSSRSLYVIAECVRLLLPGQSLSTGSCRASSGPHTQGLGVMRPQATLQGSRSSGGPRDAVRMGKQPHCLVVSLSEDYTASSIMADAQLGAEEALYGSDEV